MKKILGLAVLFGVIACGNSTAPDNSSRHLGTTLTVNVCSNNFRSVTATWADGNYTAEFMKSGVVVSTVTGNTGRVKTSACVFSKGDSASVRFTPFGDITQYLDVTTSKTIIVS